MVGTSPLIGNNKAARSKRAAHCKRRSTTSYYDDLTNGQYTEKLVGSTGTVTWIDYIRGAAA